MTHRSAGKTGAEKDVRVLLQAVPTDVVAGLVLVLFAALSLVATQDLAFGSAARMGPGYFPRIVSGLIGLFGIATVAMGLMKGRMSKPADAMPGVPWRALVMIMLAMAFFATSVEHLGLLLSGFGTILLASLASPRAKPLEIAVFSLVLAVVVTAIFSWGLGLSLPAWPNFG
ncbi:MAG TPA: tripartite tricarboxylate transporter TctB family protein [Devosia sp.]|nr:tripartite tricarboxylate transporter TctB family protein [Devosia sp.]